MLTCPACKLALRQLGQAPTPPTEEQRSSLVEKAQTITGTHDGPLLNLHSELTG